MTCLRENDVGLQLKEQRLVHSVEGLSRAQGLADLVVHILGRREFCSGGGQDGELGQGDRAIVALVAAEWHMGGGF